MLKGIDIYDMLYVLMNDLSCSGPAPRSQAEAIEEPETAEEQ